MDDYLSNTFVFDDSIYKYLVDIYGEEKIDDYFGEIINKGDRFTNLCEKIKLDSRNYDMVIEKVLLRRIIKIKQEINELIKQSGINVDNITLLCDKMAYISDNIKDEKLLRMINTLYQEFVVIRGNIWQYYLPLLDGVMAKYSDDSKYDDIYQEASISLLTAIEKFDVNNYSFSSYATNYIRYGVNYHYHDLDLSINIPINTQHKYYKMIKTIYHYLYVHRRPVSKDELIKWLNLNDITVTVFLSLFTGEVISFDDVNLVRDEYYKYEELIGLNEEIRSLEDEAIDNNLHDTLNLALCELNDRERMVIDNYFLNDERLTLGQIVKKLGVSYGTGMNIKKRALKKLSKHKKEFLEYLR